MSQDGESMTGSTVGSGILRLDTSHVVFFGGMQPGVFNRYLCNATAKDNGLYGWFLALFPATGSKAPGL